MAEILQFLFLMFSIEMVISQTGENPILEYTVAEEIPKAFVGSVSASKYIQDKYNIEIINSFQYQFLPQPNQDDSLFTLDTNTGEMRTSGSINRELYCPGLVTCYLFIDVAVVEPRDFFQVMTAKIEVLDINDFKPKFQKEQIDLVFSESAANGTSRTLAPATDLDSPIYGMKSYQLTPDSKEFGLMSPGDQGNAGDNLKLYVKGKLDRERKDMYTFKVHAYDGGSPSLNTTLDITITVEDANDNPPQFSQTQYEVSIKENWQLNKAFLQVSATDIDEGINGKVTYSLSSTSESAYGSTFGIDAENGDIFLKSQIDYETKKKYDLVVIATDGGIDSNVVEAKVMIIVIDVNDYVPKVTVNTLTENNEAVISESDLPGTFVAYVSVFDADSGRNKETLCSLTDPSFGLESLSKSSSQYKVVTTKTFDRERRDTYTLVIQCTDKGEVPLKGIRNFTVKINDSNDNPPIFEQSEYSITVLENNIIGDVLLTVKATDEDINENSELLYSMTDGALSQFVQVDPLTGDIIAKVSLDYEMLKSLSFEVVVKDSGDPILEGRAMVKIHLEDVNDEAPTFNKQIYTYDIYENELLLSPLGDAVSAKDLDSEPFNQVEYSLQDSPDSALFSINSATGLIISESSMDRELQDRYSFHVIATDKKDKNLSSMTSVLVNVLDRNDNAPTIIFPARGNNTAKISNKIPAGFIACYVNARDIDLYENARLTYAIYDDVNNKIKDLFVIDIDTGAIITTADVKNLDGDTFRLSVVVKDNGDPVKTATDYLIIKIDSNVPFISGGSEELVESSNLTTIIAVSTVSSIIVVGLAVVIIFIKLKDTREKAKAKSLMPHFTVSKQEGKRYDGVDNIAQIYTTENEYKNPKSIFQISSNQTGIQPKPDINSSICTISSDHSLLYDKRLEHRSLDQHQGHAMDEELDSNSSTDISNADSGRGPSVDEDLNNSKREYPSRNPPVPDLLQRREQMRMSEQELSHHHHQSPPELPPKQHNQPPSYESFLRRKSQGSGKRNKHIHFADDYNNGHHPPTAGVPRHTAKQACDNSQHILNLQHQTKQQYYNRDSDKTSENNSNSTQNSCNNRINNDRYIGQGPSVEPRSGHVQVIENTFSSVMV